MSQGKDVQELLKKGIEEARENNKEAARGLFERVVELDENNEKGWFWLASVVETDEERRICLRNVLHINPNNERAQKMLDKIDAREKAIAAESDIIPGISHRQFSLAIGGGVLAILVILIAFLAVSSATRGRQQAEQQQTQVAIAGITATIEQIGTQAAAVAQTAAAQITPSATTAPPTRTQIATWTPTPSETPFGVAASTLPPPTGLTGMLAGWSGRDVQNIGYLPIGTFDVVNGTFKPSTDKLGRDVDIRPDGQRLAFTQYDPTFFSTFIGEMNLNGTQAESLSDRWKGFLAVLQPQMPRYGQGGNWLVFIAQDQDTLTPQVYLLNLTLPPGGDPKSSPNPVRQLTSDKATYSYPAVSPDGQHVVVVRDDKDGPTPGADLVVIDVGNLEQKAITTDYSAFIETTPHFSPDGSQVIYAAAPANEPNNYDIAIRNADGSGAPILPVRSPNNDIYPVYSPDGRKFAFSSNRNGAYDIFIFDMATNALSQLTNTPEEDYAGAWWQPPS